MDCEKYIEYVNNNTESIEAYVDTCFEEGKEFFRAKLVKLIKDSITPLPPHYILTHYNDPPYDHSGELVEKGIIDTSQTVEDFLANEYVGAWIATYEKGMGKEWPTYEDSFREDTLDWGNSTMISAIRKCIETEFSVSLSNDEFEQIAHGCNDFDDIIDNTKASDFFYPSMVAEFVDILNLRLSEL